MKLKALNKDLVKATYDKTAKYYDLFHNLGTFNIDRYGRKYLVRKIVKSGDFILDAGGGTGATSLLAVKTYGEKTKAVVLDFSENMLQQALEKAKEEQVEDRVTIKVGDMYDIPYPDNCFDVVISTYSACPLENPAIAVREMIRVLKINGYLGIAHSSQPDNKILKKVSDFFEKIIWKFPRLSLGCRNIDLLGDIETMNVKIIENKLIGFVPWYFRLLILQKTEQ